MTLAFALIEILASLGTILITWKILRFPGRNDRLARKDQREYDKRLRKDFRAGDPHIVHPSWVTEEGKCPCKDCVGGNQK
jgi:hypothetical protein